MQEKQIYSTSTIAEVTNGIIVAKGYVDYAGDELDSIIPPISRRQGAREKKKMDVLEKIKNIVDVFVGI